jgi:hypothetical protein
MPNLPPRTGPTPQEIYQRQLGDAEHDRLQHRMNVAAASPQRPYQLRELQHALPAVVPAANREPDLPEAGDGYQQRLLDFVAASGIAGRLVKFGKAGVFALADDDTEVSPDRDFVALADETLVGWIKFGEQGAAPEKHQGLLYDGYVLPQRSKLGDHDESQWPTGLSGQPEDPWKLQFSLVLQDRESFELFTYGTMSKTGRRCIGNLLKYYDRLQKTDPDSYPLVRLKSGGYNHRDPRVGWVATPVLAVVGKAPKASAAVPDSSPATDMNDSVPF